MKQEPSCSQTVNQDLLKLLRLFRRHIGILIACLALGLLISGTYGIYLKPRRYSADVLLYIWQTKGSNQSEALTASDLNLYSQLVYDYQALVKSRLVTQQVADELGMSPAQYAQLPQKITVGTKENTRLITITVLDEDPQAAAAIASTMAKHFSNTVVEKMGAANVQVIDPAVVPQAPVSRGLMFLLAIGGLAGLLLGVGTVLLRSALDTTIRTAGDVESLTGFPLLGVIQKYEKASVAGRGLFAHVRTRPKANRLSAELINRNSQLSVTSEAFKAARTSIEFSTKGRRIRSMMVTSTQEDEGKTVTLANLAITYAQMGRRVLLVDADLHSPSLHDYFGLMNTGGLTSVLAGMGHFSEYVRATSTENLFVLTAGPIPSNPADLLISQTMSDLIKELTDNYGLVLIDCPPVGVVTDASIVAARVDATLFAVRSGVTNRSHLQRAAGFLERVHASVIGFVMNGVDRRSEDYSYAYDRFVRSLHGMKKSATGHGMMTAAPLQKQPVSASEASASFLPTESHAKKPGSGIHHDSVQDWKG